MTATGLGEGDGGRDGQGREAMIDEWRHAASGMLREGQYGTVMLT